MINMLVKLLNLILRLRYRIKVKGLDKIDKKDPRGILFIPNHPALIDPPIVFSSIFPRFQLRPLSDENQVNKPILSTLMRKINCVTIPDMKLQGRKGKEGVIRAMQEVTDGLKQGDNFLFYPSGRLYRTQHESLRGNSGVAQILKEVPDVRVVLVRTTGLWGSSFSRASGEKPALLKDLKKKLLALLAGGLFFIPKREVTIELTEVTGLPPADDHLALNKYLENYYNQQAPPNTYVPYFWWQKEGAQSRPEPITKNATGNIARVSGETRKQVFAKIAELSGNNGFKEIDTLASDVGMDSLTVTELAVWIEQEFGHPVDNMEELTIVSDVLLAASGQLVSTSSDKKIEAPPAWQCLKNDNLLACADKDTITAMFLAQAKKNPSLPVMADIIGGVKTYRDIITSIFALVPVLKKMKETNIGLMLPAGVACTTVYYGLLFAGKTPVMVNWTMGESNLNYCLDKVGVKRVITARALLTKLSSQGFETKSNPFSWVCLEDIGKELSTFAKLRAKIKSYTSISSLANNKTKATAAILFTSGSEARPKAVPLSHKNFIANIASVNNTFGARNNDVLVGMLPPFHSLGLTGTVIFPMSLGLQVVYHANPTEAAIIADIIQKYGVTLLIGTPTFLNGILRGAEKGQLSSLRLSFTGAEKCPLHLYETMVKEYPGNTLCEGYGVTECAPLISLNDPQNPVQGSIGKVADSMEYVIVDPETKDIEVKPGDKGILLVRGDNVFSGYLNHEGRQPFIMFEGKQWYETGDLVSEDQNQVLHFGGRLKRFVKLGGEMISLPAIEATLLEKLDFPPLDGIPFAVEVYGDDEAPELILFTTFKTERHDVNQAIRAGGLSPLHNIRKVIMIDEIPVLGTGKTDYQSLKKML